MKNTSPAKRIISVFLCAVICLCAAAALTACGSDSGNNYLVPHYKILSQDDKPTDEELHEILRINTAEFWVTCSDAVLANAISEFTFVSPEKIKITGVDGRGTSTRTDPKPIDNTWIEGYVSAEFEALDGSIQNNKYYFTSEFSIDCYAPGNNRCLSCKIKQTAQ